MSQRVSEGDSPEGMRRLSVAAPSGETSHAPNRMSQSKPWCERVASGQRRHLMFTDIPRRSCQRANQSTGENSPRLQCIETENLTGMSRVRTPIINDVKDLCSHDPAQNNQNPQVPRQFPVNPLLLRLAHTDPQSEQH